MHVATGYVSLDGLDSLAKLGLDREHPSRLLIGVTPETLVGSPRETAANRFQHSVLQRSGASATSPPSPPCAGLCSKG